MELQKTFTVEEIQEYFKGFTWIGEDDKPMPMTSACAWNGWVMLDDHQDGIEAYYERQAHYKAKKPE